MAFCSSSDFKAKFKLETKSTLRKVPSRIITVSSRISVKGKNFCVEAWVAALGLLIIKKGVLIFLVFLILRFSMFISIEYLVGADCQNWFFLSFFARCFEFPLRHKRRRCPPLKPWKPNAIEKIAL